MSDPLHPRTIVEGLMSIAGAVLALAHRLDRLTDAIQGARGRTAFLSSEPVEDDPPEMVQ